MSSFWFGGLDFSFFVQLADAFESAANVVGMVDHPFLLYDQL